jgi:hypothetical protein
MVRVVQPEGRRGSLKWIQRAVEERWPELEDPILHRLPEARAIEWRSPVRGDEYAEYRDADFLTLLGLGDLTRSLASFWPRRGPQWDALARTDAGDVLLVEAKAHVREFCSPATSAGLESRSLIEARLEEVARALDAAPGRPWADMFYQLANRLAHLWFLRQRGVPAYLILVGFLGDEEMGGPKNAETWEAAYEVANYALGLPSRHPLSPFLIHVHPAVTA